MFAVISRHPSNIKGHHLVLGYYNLGDIVDAIVDGVVFSHKQFDVVHTDSMTYWWRTEGFHKFGRGLPE